MPSSRSASPTSALEDALAAAATREGAFLAAPVARPSGQSALRRCSAAMRTGASPTRWRGSLSALMRKPRALQAGRSHRDRGARQPLQPRRVRPRRRGDRAARIRAGLRRRRSSSAQRYLGWLGRASGLTLRRGLDRPGRRGAARRARRIRQRRSCCRCSIASECAGAPKLFIGYSDNTSLLSWLTCQCGIAALHGPMLEGRLAAGREGYDERVVSRAPVWRPMGSSWQPEGLDASCGQARRAARCSEAR